MRNPLILSLAFACSLGAAEPAAKNPDLSWLTGDWIMEEDGGVTREQWGKQQGLVIRGTSQSGKKGKKPGFSEVMQIIADKNGGLTFWAQPNGAKQPTPFKFDAAHYQMHKNWIFENPKNEYPQRIIYWRDGGWLFATIMQLDGSKEKNFAYRLENPPKAKAGTALPGMSSVRDAVSVSRTCLDKDGFTLCEPPRRLHIRNLVCWPDTDLAGYIEPYRTSPAAECSFESMTTPFTKSALAPSGTKWHADWARLHRINGGWVVPTN